MANATSIQFWAGTLKTVNWPTSHPPIDASQREAYNKKLTPALRNDLNEKRIANWGGARERILGPLT